MVGPRGGGKCETQLTQWKRKKKAVSRPGDRTIHSLSYKLMRLPTWVLSLPLDMSPSQISDVPVDADPISVDDVIAICNFKWVNGNPDSPNAIGI